MSGHSKWANIKRRKGAQDEARGKVFTKISKEIFVAVRHGGPDIDGNFRLKLIVSKARANNMPIDNINRAIQKAAGNSDSNAFDEVIYEGYGPAGVAVICEILTDNRNRIASEARYIFSRNHGNLGETGCVGWMFQRKGRIVIDMEGLDEDEVMMIALDAGAEDFTVEDGEGEVITASDALESVRQALEDAKIPVGESAVDLIPDNTIEIDDIETARTVLNLIEKLEDNDDIQNVYHNAEITDEIMEILANE